jgi:hypothetical protein
MIIAPMTEPAAATVEVPLVLAMRSRLPQLGLAIFSLGKTPRGY